MPIVTYRSRSARSALLLRSTLVLLVCCAGAHATDTYDGKNLSIPTLQIGAATFTNVVVVPASPSAPAGGSPLGYLDTYDPTTGILTIPEVVYGGKSYTNLTAKVSKLVSVGAVTGVDTYNGVTLTIPSVQFPTGLVYDNVTVTPGNILSIGGGMPQHARDAYDPASGQLTIAAIRLGNTVYTNPIITIKKVTGAGAGETVLHSFADTTGISGVVDGGYPIGLIQGSDGNFYAATSAGGRYDNGALIKVTPAGAESLISSFGTVAQDGNDPTCLIQGSDGNFYGTTHAGGAYSQGTLFKVNATTGVRSTLYSFGAPGSKGGVSTDATSPTCLIQAQDGNFYGTSYQGGANDQGSVWQVTPVGVEKLIYSFSAATGNGGNAGPNYPEAGVIEGSDHNLYGIATLGGTNSQGAVFRITTSGSLTTLYSFGSAPSGSTDGAYPATPLVQGTDGNFYGVTGNGGAYFQGTVYKVTPAGVESVLYAFSGGGGGVAGSNDGSLPLALIQAKDGNFYGTTGGGGVYNHGTVFGITPAGAESVIYSFSGTNGSPGAVDGAGPCSLIQGTDGNFYGMTTTEGSYAFGTLFRLTNVHLP